MAIRDNVEIESWFGWKSVQTAYNYLELGARSIKKTSVAMVEKHTGKKVELLPEKVESDEEELVEQSAIEP